MEIEHFVVVWCFVKEKRHSSEFKWTGESDEKSASFSPPVPLVRTAFVFLLSLTVEYDGRKYGESCGYNDALLPGEPE